MRNPGLADTPSQEALARGPQDRNRLHNAEATDQDHLQETRKGDRENTKHRPDAIAKDFTLTEVKPIWYRTASAKENLSPLSQVRKDESP